MNRIDKLIQKLCPNGVEYKAIGDVAEVFTGGEAPENCIKGEVGNEKFRYPIYANGSEVYGFTDTYKIDRDAVTISSIGANTGVIYFRNAFFTPIIRLKVILPKEDKFLPRFLFHYLTSINIYSKKSSVPNLNADDVKKISIPLPPLPIQEEIVNILDKFTLLEAELEAELEARKKQYEHYRDRLLSFEGKNVEWKTLGEIGEFIRGNGLQKKDFTETGVGCIHYGQIYTHYGSHAEKTKSFVSPVLAKKLKKASKNDLVIAGVSENIEDVCKAVVWLGDEDICISGDAFIFKHKQDPKYIGYLLQTKRFLEFKKKYAQGAKVTRLQSGSLPKFTVPIPSLTEQKRIADILDKFDALVNDISNGLPAEIAARKKQYEYYRNRLLTFKPINE